MQLPPEVVCTELGMIVNVQLGLGLLRISESGRIDGSCDVYYTGTSSPIL